MGMTWGSGFTALGMWLSPWFGLPFFVVSVVLMVAHMRDYYRMPTDSERS
jgi:hypothetical protein